MRGPGETKEGVAYDWDLEKMFGIQMGAETGVQKWTHRQLVVPQKYRRKLLQIAHDIPHANYLGLRKTSHRLTQNFF